MAIIVTCTQCGKRGIFLPVNNLGHCEDCINKNKCLTPPGKKHGEASKNKVPHFKLLLVCLLLIAVVFVWTLISTFKDIDRWEQLSAETGLSVESLQELESLAASTGADFDALFLSQISKQLH